MPVTPAPPAPARPRAAELNEAIRQLCAGRVVWSQAALDQLAELRARWQAAVDEEQAAA